MAVSQDPPASLFERRGVRLTLVGLVGLYLFIVCAAYIAREPIKPSISFLVLGPEVITPGEIFPVRAIAYRHGQRAHLTTSIDAATISARDGDEAVELVEPTPGIPGLAHVSEAPVVEGPFSLTLTLSAGEGGARQLEVPMVVYHPRANVDPLPLALADEVPTDSTLVVEALPEGPGLAMGTNSRVWLRVTTPSGAPASGAALSWTVKGGTPAEGTSTTDEAGVAPIDISANQLTTRLRIDAKRGAETGVLETTLHPMGRSVVLSAERMLQARGEPPLPITVRRTDPDEWIFCDLYRGEAWLRTWQLDPELGEQVSVTVDLPSAGTFELQCYDHFATPGDSADGMWLFKSDKARVEASRELLRPASSSSRTRAYRHDVPVVGGASVTAMFSGFRTRQVEVRPPSILATTRNDDEAAAKLENEKVQGKFFILIAASFALVLLGAFQYGIQSAIENRQRMALAIEELGEMAVEVPPATKLVRARMAVQVAFVVLVLVLNIAAMLALFQYM